jgi:hypothetical protein
VKPIQSYFLMSLTLVFMSACFGPKSSSKVSEVSKTQESKDCALSPGKYELQSVTFHSGKGAYDFFVVGAASCVKQPVTFEKVRLVRVETPDKKPSAKLEVPSAEDPILQLTEDFKIEMVSAVVENGQVVKEETSSWMPFLAGAAGAAVAGMAMNAMFNKPQYYQPPPMRPGMADVRGYGAAAPTHQGAMSNYQSKYNAPVPSAVQKSALQRRAELSKNPNGQLSQQSIRKNSSPTRTQPSRSKPGFFKRRR